MGFKSVFGIALTLDFNEVLLDLIGFSCFFLMFCRGYIGIFQRSIGE